MSEGKTTEAPVKQGRASLKSPPLPVPSESTEEAVDIVDQLLAGGTPSKEQLLTIKREVECTSHHVSYLRNHMCSK